MGENAGRPRSLRAAAELAAARPHGDRVRYIGGCRCSDCRRANTDYEKARAAARKAGDWNGLVPAARALAHMLALSAAGIGRRQIADASGVAETVLSGIRSGKRLQLRARNEKAILAVTEEAAADCAHVDARPAWRLLKELLDAGYSAAHLARELGYSSPRLQLGRLKCTRRNAYDVEQLHQRLRRVPADRTRKLLASLREEGFREQQVEQMVADAAARKALPPPDLREYVGRTRRGAYISAAAAALIEHVHAAVTGEEYQPAVRRREPFNEARGMQ